MKTTTIIYYVSTTLFSLMMLFGAISYLTQFEKVSSLFEALGHPAHIIVPYAIAKILGVVAIWGNFSKLLKEWAYAGFVFGTALATLAHITAGDGEQWGALMAMTLVIVSRVYWGKLSAAQA